MSFWRSLLKWTRWFTVTLVVAVSLLWSAIFVYALFYHYYVPTLSFKIPLVFQFDTRCLENCMPPYTMVSLTTDGRQSIFARGQPYKFMLKMKLPESQVNWDQGMFMVKIELYNAQKKVVLTSAAPSMLRYKSPLTRSLAAVLWPEWLFTTASEQQDLVIPLLENYYHTFTNEDAVSAKLSIEARNIQLYSASLLIDTRLQGVSYYMVQWPLTSAFMGTISFTSLLSSIFFSVIFAIFSVTNRSRNESTWLMQDLDTNETNQELPPENFGGAVVPTPGLNLGPDPPDDQNTDGTGSTSAVEPQLTEADK